MVALNINGKSQTVEVDPDTPLLWAIREQLGLTGTKFGCGIAQQFRPHFSAVKNELFCLTKGQSDGFLSGLAAGENLRGLG